MSVQSCALRRLRTVRTRKLDPSHILNVLSQFNDDGWEAIHQDIAMTHLGLRGIRELCESKDIEPGAMVDIWKRAWAWIQFLDETEYILAGATFNDNVSQHVLFLDVTRLLRACPVASMLIDSTSGLCVVWDKQGWSAPVFDNLVMGSGGSYDQLASLGRSTHQAGCGKHQREDLITGHQDSAFRNSLACAGILFPLITAARALMQSPERAMDPVTFLLPAILGHLSFAGVRTLPQALDCGLLDLVLTACNQKPNLPNLHQLLTHLLVPATVYHSVLAALETSMTGVIPGSSKSGCPPIWVCVEHLLSLIKCQLVVWRAYDEGRCGILTSACASCKRKLRVVRGYYIVT
ncbi:hypothetical protein K438DRAFT_1785643 [Mycena galopus ATCC 62051]|nr:hypothetical protein K438DRAFT_1785643 [Mycena galopus ATCC 62051]